ncbi:MAG: methyl-accepting chemotaxis protein [Clostridiales bacterium]|jgi:methyl-accepting chemotaxis protein|nr:methyl-accepting chemotaxis protein [Clostridiales bacterium]
MRKQAKRLSMGTRVSRAVIGLIMLSIFLIGLFSFLIYRTDSMEKYLANAEDVSATIAEMLDPVSLQASMDSPEKDEYWFYVKGLFDNLKTKLDVTYLYIIAPYNDIWFKYYVEGLKPGDNPEEIFDFNDVEEDTDVYGENVFEIMRGKVPAVEDPYYTEAFGTLVTGFAPVLNSEGESIAVVGVDFSVQAVMVDSNRFAMYIIAAGLVLSAIFGFIMQSYIKHLLSYTLRRITGGMKLLYEGDMTFRARKQDTIDEIGVLYGSFSQVTTTFNILVNDMGEMSRRHADGEYEARLDESKYTGVYLDVVKGINEMVSMYIDNFMELLDVVQHYGNGNFDANVHSYPGRLSLANGIVDKLRSDFSHINSEIINVAETALNGNLSVRADAGAFQGGWAKILTDLNQLIEALVIPMQEASNVLKKVSDGYLDVKMTGQYKGDLSVLKDNMNKTVDELADYIKEIRVILQAVAKNDLSIKASRKFHGDFAAIEEAIGSIISDQDHFFRQIGQISSLLNENASQISQSGTRLSKNAADQRETIEKLTGNITYIGEQTLDNSKNAGKAENISVISKQNADNGNKEMKKMLYSMNAIKDAANNIAKIIQVIDGIAFQTNLLAINAAVEAARAGEHGKGFIVVADEVRSLATRSLNAAHETQALIEETLNRVNEGSETAKSTSDALFEIINNVNSVSELVSLISSASVRQEDAVRQLTSGIEQFSAGVLDNTKMADENASASEELAQQSDSLNKLLGAVRFKK